MPTKDVSYRKELLETEDAEEILQDNPSRWVILPIKFPAVWNMFKKHEMSFWTAEDIDYSADGPDMAKMSQPLVDTFKHIAAVAAVSDGGLRYCVRSCGLLDYIQIPEARAFYGFQCAFETIHEEVYSHLLLEYVKDESERKLLCEEVLELPCLIEKSKFFHDAQESGVPFIERIIYLLLSKKLLSSVYRFLKAWCLREKRLPSYCKARKQIGGDEDIQTQFCVVLYNSLKFHPPHSVISDLVSKCVNIEKMFADDVLCYSELGVSREDFHTYIEAVGDTVLKDLSVPRLYSSSNPFTWFKIESREDAENAEKKPFSDAGGKQNMPMNEQAADISMMNQSLNDSNKLTFDEDF